MRIPIEGEFIELGQLLKKLHFVSSGGQAKIFLEKNRVTVNGEREQRRGRKLRPGDVVRVEGFAEVLEIAGKE
ncbi:MAG TPA: S4 domain-containing protein YaaA [Fimbriimonadales bacterium]|nr:S4 domain-containing protein YaaA [Fimbriimonadales bacterium]